MLDMTELAKAITELGAPAEAWGYPGPTDVAVEAVGGGRILLAYGFNTDDGWEAVWESPDPDSDEQVPLCDGPVGEDSPLQVVATWAWILADDWRAYVV